MTKQERELWDVYNDIVNICEDNYSKEDKAQAYKEALEKSNKLQKKYDKDAS